MVKHRDLIGSELHGTKVALEAPTRSPAFAGEVIFDGTLMWVAMNVTADSWRRGSPTLQMPRVNGFSWAIALAPFIGQSNVSIGLYYGNGTNFSMGGFASSDVPTNWLLLQRYPITADGSGLSFRGVLDFTSWVARRAHGWYLPAVEGTTAGQANPVIESTMLIPDPDLFTAARVTGVGRFAEPGTTRIYQRANALRITDPAAACIATLVRGD